AATGHAAGAGLPTDCGFPIVDSDGRVVRHACVRSIAIDPTASATLYAGTDDRGVYRSTDGGDTWSAAGGMGEHAVVTRAVDPSTPERLYAAVAEAHDPTTGLSIQSAGGRVYRSDDRGATWHEASNGLSHAPVAALAIDPSHPDTVYAATEGAGVFASQDGGATWTAANRGIDATCFIRLAALPTTPTTLLAATYYDEETPLRVSSDGGATWAAASIDADAYLVTLVNDPSDPTTAYAVSYDGKLFKSSDGGRTGAVRTQTTDAEDGALGP